MLGYYHKELESLSYILIIQQNKDTEVDYDIKILWSIYYFLELLSFINKKS